jgi:hypothetical protein
VIWLYDYQGPSGLRPSASYAEQLGFYGVHHDSAPSPLAQRRVKSETLGVLRRLQAVMASGARQLIWFHLLPASAAVGLTISR